ELPRLAAGDDLDELVARDADERPLRREDPLDDRGELELRVLEAEEEDLGVLVDRGDDLLRLERQARLRRRREEVDVGDDDDRARLARAHDVAELADHELEEAALHLLADLRRAAL